MSFGLIETKNISGYLPLHSIEPFNSFAFLRGSIPFHMHSNRELMAEHFDFFFLFLLMWIGVNDCETPNMNTNRFQFHHKRCEGVRVSLTQVVIRIFYELWMQNRFSNTSIDEKSNDAFHYFSIIVVFLFNNKFVSLLLGRYLHVPHHASFCSQTYELFPIFSRHSSLQTLFLKQLFIFIPQPLFCIYFCLAHYRQFNICG